MRYSFFYELLIDQQISSSYFYNNLENCHYCTSKLFLLILHTYDSSFNDTMKKVLLLISNLIVTMLSTAAFAVSTDDVDEALRCLDTVLEQSAQYAEKRLSKIDSLKSLVNDNTPIDRRLHLLMELGDVYTAFDNDSALIYYSRGHDHSSEAGDSLYAYRFKVKRAAILPLSCFVADAVNEYESIDPSWLPDNELPLYHESGRQMYSYIASLFASYDTVAKVWNDKANTQRRTLLKILDASSLDRMLHQGEEYIDQGDYKMARLTLLELLEHITSDSNLYARACHMLAVIARQKDDRNEEIYYLAHSAIADIKGAVREVMSLQELGQILALEDDINRAYNYLSNALTFAVNCNATMRIVQSSAALPLIQSTHSEQIDAWKHRINWIIGFLIMALIVLLGTVIALRKQMRKQAQLKTKLQNANQVKEIYISQFFQLCSIYIDKLNQFCKIANRKISLGQVNDLYKITKSGKIIEEQSQEFYRLFDDAFLHIYPTFVEDVNNLLREKIVLKEGELLNNDLRILAFQRLGLEDTNQVALILNYSVNTIYAYRNKLRNRAYDRDNFERNIMSIGALYE